MLNPARLTSLVRPDAEHEQHGQSPPETDYVWALSCAGPSGVPCSARDNIIPFFIEYTDEDACGLHFSTYENGRNL